MARPPPSWSAADEAVSRQASPPHDSPAVPDPVFPEDALQASLTISRNKVVLDLHTRLSPFFPSHFHQDEVAVPYYEEQPPRASLLVIDPDLSRSWFCPPLSVPTDTHGYWKPSERVKLPPNRSKLFPPNPKVKPLGRAPHYYVADEALREKFQAPTLGSVSLDPQVFDKGEVSVGTSPLALLEAHMRASLLESYTTEAYLQIVFELSKCAAGTSDVVPQVEALELLPQVVKQCAMASARTSQSLAAGYVGNVIALRDLVLDRFTTQPRTINVLRGGHFLGPSLFGPLPESFSALLDTPQGAKYRCSSVAPRSKAPARSTPAPAAAPAAVASVSGFKRSYPSVSNAYDAKRSKPAAPSGRGAPFPGGYKKPAGRGRGQYGRS